MDIVIVGDLSGSTVEFQYDIQNAFKSFVNRFELGEEQVKIGLVVFSMQYGIITSITSDKQKLYNGINTMFAYPLGIKTSISVGLNGGYNEILVNGREDAKKIIIFISDGSDNDDRIKMFNTIKKVKNDPRVMTCGVLIDNRVSSPEVMGALSDDFCYVSTYYHDLQDTLERMIFCM